MVYGKPKALKMACEVVMRVYFVLLIARTTEELEMLVQRSEEPPK